MCRPGSDMVPESCVWGRSNKEAPLAEPKAVINIPAIAVILFVEAAKFEKKGSPGHHAEPHYGTVVCDHTFDADVPHIIRSGSIGVSEKAKRTQDDARLLEETIWVKDFAANGTDLGTLTLLEQCEVCFGREKFHGVIEEKEEISPSLSGHRIIISRNIIRGFFGRYNIGEGDIMNHACFVGFGGGRSHTDDFSLSTRNEGSDAPEKW